MQNGFTASLAIYLDSTWATGSGFDYSVAVNNQSGAHLRDFIFHVGVVGGDLLVNGSNNTDYSLNDGKLTNGSNYTVADAGWYTFEQSFYDDGGNLAVDLNLKDSLGTTVYTKTLGTLDDIAATVGGNRYGYFAFNNVEGLAIDSSQLLGNVVPEPSTFALVCCGITGFVARKRLKRRA
ncbi:hypothetical protein KOR42_43920 [Thalassoglobus neptunius]|uniref:PEP-CTERM protein-sorting domain-containing protein n=2 Tax=Thalassoglobus neptunius TaxID=1938619 RepID=A0A5C5VYU1_9PLAN|nr:hypothetical protein KOR42_43920 [Thalassoglobus neptunius]